MGISSPLPRLSTHRIFVKSVGISWRKRGRSSLAIPTLVGLLVAGLASPATALEPVPAGPGVEASPVPPETAFSSKNLSTWQTNGTVWALASAGSTVFAGGTFSEITPPDGAPGTRTAALNLASFDAATGEPKSCRPAITASSGIATVRALEVSPDQKTLYVGGHFTQIAGVAVARLAAVDIATCTVTAFRPGSISATVRALAVTEGAVYLGGDFSTVRGSTRQKFAAVARSTGQLLPWTVNADANGRALDVSSDGRMVAVGGDFFSLNGAYAHSFAITDAASGAVTKAYAPGFIPDTSVTKAITSDATGFYIGNEGTGGGVFDGRFAVDYSTLEQRWRDTCLGATQAVVAYADVLYAANHAHACEGMGWQPDGRRVYLTAESTQGPQPISWVPELNDGIGEGIGPRALVRAVVGNTSYLWTGGEFTRTNGSPQRGLTRFAEGRSAKPEAPSRVTAESLQAGRMQVRWRASNDADSTNLSYSVFRNGESQPFAQIAGSSFWWQLPQMSVVDTAVEAGKAYTYRVEVADGQSTVMSTMSGPVTAVAADVAYASAVLKDGASLYWRYNEQADVHGADSSPGNYRAAYMQSPVRRAGEDIAGPTQGSAIRFDGEKSYAYSDKLKDAPSTYSIETWFKTNTTRGGKIIGYGNGQPRTDTLETRLSGSYDRHIYMANNGQLIFGAYTGSAVTIKSPGTYNDNVWHHVVATQGPTGMRMYVDGKGVGKNSNTAAQSYRGSWRVGGDSLNGWPDAPASSFFAGDVDETAIYSGALTSTQVANHYSASGRTVDLPTKPKDAFGAAVYEAEPDFFWRFETVNDARATDSGIQSIDGLLQAGAVQTSAGFIDAGLALGAEGFASASVGTSRPGAFSTELWFRTESTRGGRLIGFGNNPSGLSNNYDRHVYVRDDGRLVFGVWSGQESLAVSQGSFNDGEWHHVVATQSNEGMKLYVDGAEVGANPQAAAQAYDGFWKVGSDNIWGGASTKILDGVIDEVAVYPRALSPGEVRGHFDAAPKAPIDPSTVPAAPQALSVSIEGRDVVLSWSAGGSTPAGQTYRITRSAIDGSSATQDVGRATEPSFRDIDPGSGSWSYSVIAVSATSIESTPSSSVQIDVPEEQGPTISAPVDLSANRDGADVVLAWSEQGEVEAATFSVYRSSSPKFEDNISLIGENLTEPTFRDAAPGAGTWFYRVTATDSAGLESPPSETTEVAITAVDATPPTVPGQVSVVGQNGAAVLNWVASADESEPVTYEVHRASSRGFETSPDTLIGDSVLPTFTDDGLGQGTWFYRIVALDAAGNRSQGSAPVTFGVQAQPVDLSMTPIEDAMVNEGARTTNYGTSSQLASRKSTGYESYLRFKMPVIPEGMGVVKAALTVSSSTSTFAGSVEPHVVSLVTGSWDEGAVTWNNRPALGERLGAYESPAAVNQTYSAVLDPVALSGVKSEEVLNLAVSGTGADNFWFWSANQSQQQLQPRLQLTLGPVDGGGAGEQPPPAPVEPQPVPVEPVTVVVPASADTMVNSQAAAVEYGAANQLASRGSTHYSSYLRFDLPETPAGMVLSEATLTVRTSSAEFAGSADAHAVAVVDAGWNESGMNFASRPDSGTVVGSFAGESRPSASIVAPLLSEEVVKALAGRFAVSVTSSGNDNLWFWSREQSNPNLRPVMTLTFKEG